MSPLAVVENLNLLPDGGFSLGPGRVAAMMHQFILEASPEVMMPKKSGRQMYDEISRIKPETRVLFISGYSADMIEKKVILGENADFITKPFTKKDLLGKTKKILGRRLDKK
jgi:YesN/AraC family two-component response regulator